LITSRWGGKKENFLSGGGSESSEKNLFRCPKEKGGGCLLLRGDEEYRLAVGEGESPSGRGKKGEVSLKKSPWKILTKKTPINGKGGICAKGGGGFFQFTKGRETWVEESTTSEGSLRFWGERKFFLWEVRLDLNGGCPLLLWRREWGEGGLTFSGNAFKSFGDNRTKGRIFRSLRKRRS